MTRYRSSFACAVCGEHLIWDSGSKRLSCRCGSRHCEFVNLKEYAPVEAAPLDVSFNSEIQEFKRRLNSLATQLKNIDEKAKTRTPRTQLNQEVEEVKT